MSHIEDIDRDIKMYKRLNLCCDLIIGICIIIAFIICVAMIMTKGDL